MCRASPVTATSTPHWSHLTRAPPFWRRGAAASAAGSEPATAALAARFAFGRFARGLDDVTTVESEVCPPPVAGAAAPVAVGPPSTIASPATVGATVTRRRAAFFCLRLLFAAAEEERARGLAAFCACGCGAASSVAVGGTVSPVSTSTTTAASGEITKSSATTVDRAGGSNSSNDCHSSRTPHASMRCRRVWWWCTHPYTRKTDSGGPSFADRNGLNPCLQIPNGITCSRGKERERDRERA
jgi:hypothetical protein